MKRNNFSIGSEQEHLSLSVLRRYQEGLLPASEEHRVEKHVLACELCADILAGMELQSAEQTAAAAQEISRRISASRVRPKGKLILRFSRRNLAVAATILMFLCSAGVVFLYNLEKVKQEQEPPLVAIPSGPVQPESPVLRPATPAVVPPAAPPEAAEQVALAKPGPGRTQNRPAPVTHAEAPDYPAAVADNSEAETVAAKAGTGEKGRDSVWVTNQSVAAAPPVDVSGRMAGAVVNPAAKMGPGGQSRRMAVMADVREGKVITDGQTIKGRVLSPEGAALPGVAVGLKGAPPVATTDTEGRYALTVPEAREEVVLTFHFIGYTALEKKVKIPALAVVEVTLAADSKALSEVVVVDYGRENKDAATGATDAGPMGGWRRFKEYLQANIKQPTEAGGPKVSGRVVVGFTVQPNGSLADARVIKSLSPATDAEALRLVQQGPRWQPAKAGGRAVPQPVRVSIRFRE